MLPEPHPEPSADLHAQALPLVDVDGPWIRSHLLAYGALHFGRSGFNRFDAPAGQYGILYIARDVYGAFIETFGRHLGGRAIEAARIASRGLSRISPSRPLRLVDLAGPGLSRIGADARLTATSYGLSQQWALAFHDHPDQPDGLLYRSRHDPSRLCAAIFDRAAGILTATSLGSLGDPANASLLADLLDTYDYALITP